MRIDAVLAICVLASVPVAAEEPVRAQPVQMETAQAETAPAEAVKAKPVEQGPAQSLGTGRSIIVPSGWEGAYEYGYAPVVRVGDMVIVSGVPAAGEGTYEEKIRRMYTRIGDLLEAAGATFEDVIELTSFHTAVKDSPAFQAELARYIPVHREFFGEHRPAWTAVGNTTLLSPTAVVEVRVVAVAGSARDSRVVRGKAEPPKEVDPPSPD